MHVVSLFYFAIVATAAAAAPTFGGTDSMNLLSREPEPEPSYCNGECAGWKRN